jgi:hypothetical protein
MLILRAIGFARPPGLPVEADRSASATPWPPFQPSLQPAPSASPAQASLPADVQVTPPGEDIPALVRDLSGRWGGWMGRDRRGSVAVAVERLTPTGGTITYAFADASTPPGAWRFPVRLVHGIELSGSPGGQRVITIRPRFDGHMDILSQDGTDRLAGVLARMPYTGLRKS